MEYRVVNPAEGLRQSRALVNANWAETGFDFPFDPDVDAYQRMFDAGIAFAVGAFDGDQAVGYCVVVVTAHPHCRGLLYGSNDALFVAPEGRNTMVPGRLILMAEAEAKRRGAKRFTWHCRAGTALADLLARHGYAPVDQVVMREI